MLENECKDKNIIIVGDSAGGNLTLATTLFLKNNNIDLPAGVIAISPWADLEYVAESRIENGENDLILGNKTVRMVEELKNPSYIGNNNVKNPYISPVNGDYKGFPKLLIQVGSYEVLLDDSIKVGKKAKEAGVDVTQTTYEGMSHDFQLLFPMLKTSKLAIEQIRNFINEI